MWLFPGRLILSGLILTLVGCDQSTPPAKQQTTHTEDTTSIQATGESREATVPPRDQDIQQVLRGGRIFQQNCAVCHGKLAQGAPNWRQRKEDGTFPAPPLNGNGHTWHHSMKVLKQAVRDGTIEMGGSMPAWGDKLSEQDIEDVLSWVLAQWPDDIYARWYLNNQRRQ